MEQDVHLTSLEYADWNNKINHFNAIAKEYKIDKKEVERRLTKLETKAEVDDTELKYLIKDAVAEGNEPIMEEIKLLQKRVTELENKSNKSISEATMRIIWIIIPLIVGFLFSRITNGGI